MVSGDGYRVARASAALHRLHRSRAKCPIAVMPAESLELVGSFQGLRLSSLSSSLAACSASVAGVFVSQGRPQPVTWGRTSSLRIFHWDTTLTCHVRIRPHCRPSRDSSVQSVGLGLGGPEPVILQQVGEAVEEAGSGLGSAGIGLETKTTQLHLHAAKPVGQVGGAGDVEGLDQGSLEVCDLLDSGFAGSSRLACVCLGVAEVAEDEEGGGDSKAQGGETGGKVDEEAVALPPVGVVEPETSAGKGSSDEKQDNAEATDEARCARPPLARSDHPSLLCHGSPPRERAVRGR